MSPLPDRRTLESMRRADLQKLCKDRGLKANMKTEALIDLLIETSKPEPGAPAHKRSSSMRIVSRPASSSGVRNRVGSMIIHDLDDEDDGQEAADVPMADAERAAPHGSAPQPSQIPVAAAPGPATRTRNAVDGQRRLPVGLGRPKALGGAGIRAPARTVSTAQTKRVRGSRSVPPNEVPIREEEEEQMPQAGPSGTRHDIPSNRSSPLTEPSSHTASEGNGKAPEVPSNLANPLQAQLAEAQAELRRLAAATADMGSAMADLRAEVAALRSQSTLHVDLESQVRALREEIASLRIPMSADSSHTRMASAESSGKAIATIDSHTSLAPSILPTVSSEETLTQSSLGKRSRLAENADRIPGVVEAGQEAGMSAEVLQTQVLRPARKRAKLAERELSVESLGRPAHDHDADIDADSEEAPPLPPVQRGPGFTVFSGPEEPPEDSAPSSARTDLFASSTPPHGATPSVPTASAHAAENQAPSTGNNAFTFTFATSLFGAAALQPPPSPALAALPIPAPEPPTSPSPAYVERAGGRRERNDPFHPTGPPRRPGSRNTSGGGSGATSSRAGEGSDSPAAPGRTPPLPSVPEDPPSRPGQTASTPATGAGPGTAGTAVVGMVLPGLVPLPVAPDTPAPPTKRTLYGTELEMDTRFGDFGVEGVAAMGFGWGAAAAPRF